MKKVICLAMTVVVFLVGCAGSAQRIIMTYPGQGQDPATHAADKQECDDYAKNEAQANVGAGAVGGAVTGAAIGAIAGTILGLAIGAAFGHAGRGAADGAMLGAAAGGLRGSAQGASYEQHRYLVAYKLCMQGKGYLTQ